MSGGAERGDQRHIVKKFVGVGDPTLRQVAGAAQGGKAATDIDRRQTGIEMVRAGMYDARQGIPARIDKYRRGIKAGILHRDECLVAGEAHTDFVQQPR